ncbi:hypothetical protein GQ53DRAFT_806778 [Thozetella sp. PMI_491]|nr:hypothetical protein GQ53DRAFT_806778 [Thozetella sp. PMI_491]
MVSNTLTALETEGSSTVLLIPPACVFKDSFLVIRIDLSPTVPPLFVLQYFSQDQPKSQISPEYNVLLEEEGVALRGLFIIGPKSVLHQSTVNDLPVGRNVEETIRLSQAFLFADEHEEVYSAGWRQGDKTEAQEYSFRIIAASDKR